MTSQGRVFPSGARFSLDEWKSKLLFLPLVDMDKQFRGRENILWSDYIKHSSYDDYWKAIAMAEQTIYHDRQHPSYMVLPVIPATSE